MQKLLVVIDMQNDFVTGALGTDMAAAIVQKVKQKVESYQAAGNPVWFTMDTHEPGDYEQDPPSRESALIPMHCIRGTDGWQIVPELRAYADIRIEKPTFLSPDLADKIRARLGEDVELELCGVCTDICVVANALALRGAFPKSKILVDGSCCAGTMQEKHDAALSVMCSNLVDTI